MLPESQKMIPSSLKFASFMSFEQENRPKSLKCSSKETRTQNLLSSGSPYFSSFLSLKLIVSVFDRTCCYWCWRTYVGVHEVDAVQALAPVDAALDAAQGWFALNGARRGGCSD